MFRKLKNFWYSYQIHDLPHDFWYALRTRQLRVTKFGFDWTKGDISKECCRKCRKRKEDAKELQKLLAL